MTMRPNKIEPDVLDMLLNDAEKGVTGELLRAAGQELEPRPEFAQELETRLLAGAAYAAQPVPASRKQTIVQAGIMGRMRVVFSW